MFLSVYVLQVSFLPPSRSNEQSVNNINTSVRMLVTFCNEVKMLAHTVVHSGLSDVVHLAAITTEEESKCWLWSSVVLLYRS